MRPRGLFRGAIAGILMAIGIAAFGWGVSSGIAAGTAMAADTVLVIDGALDGATPATLDLAALQALPVTTVKTVTPWTEGENLYEGVLIRDLLQHLGSPLKAVVARAMDDYQILIPVEDIRDYDVIVAYAVNGKPLPLDDKGPIWIVYPYSQHPALQKDLYFSRSVWQLTRLSVQ